MQVQEENQGGDEEDQAEGEKQSGTPYLGLLLSLSFFALIKQLLEMISLFFFGRDFLSKFYSSSGKMGENLVLSNEPQLEKEVFRKTT